MFWHTVNLHFPDDVYCAFSAAFSFRHLNRDTYLRSLSHALSWNNFNQSFSIRSLSFSQLSLSSAIITGFTVVENNYIAIDRSVNYTQGMNIAVDTKSRIIEVAKERFHSRSYADIGIKEICDGASIQKGSFYHFFPSKRDLALAVIDEFAQDWATGFVAEAFDPELAPMERLEYLVDAAYYWQASVKNARGTMSGCLFGNLTLEISTSDDVLRAKLAAVFDEAKSRFEQTLTQAIEQGDIEPLDIARTAEGMLAYLEGMILLAKSQNDPEVMYKLGSGLKSIRIEKA